MEGTITKKEIFDIASTDFATFVQEIIGLKNAEFHNELDANITNPLYKKIVVAFPRGHGKSTHISVAYPLDKIAQNHNVRILLVSSTASIAKSFMTEIINHIERNDTYKAYSQYVDLMKNKKKAVGVVPKMRNYKATQENWAGDSIVIDRTDLSIKDPTINAIGLFGAIVSKRADIIICDDVVNQENSATETQRLKVIDWIYTTVMPVLVPGGIFVYLGNTWHQDDLVARLLKDPQFDYRKKKPAIIHDATNQKLWSDWANILLDESKTVEDRRTLAEAFYQTNIKKLNEGIEVLWPERYGYRDLYLMRLANPYSFARMYQCDPSDRPDQKFKDAWIEMAARKGAGLRLQDEERPGLVMEVTASGLDLAISLETNADDTCLLTLDKVKWVDEKIHPMIKAGDFIPRNIQRGKMTPNSVRLMVKDHSDKVRPDGIRVESVAYQEAMVRDLADLGIAGVTGYHTGGEKNDPDIGVNSLAIIAENGKLVLPYDITDQHTTKEVSKLMNEMRAYPDGHTGDALMALWFAFSEIRDLTGNKISIPAYQTPKEIDLKNPEVLKAEEKKADQAFILEQQHELETFRRMMGGVGF